MRGVGCLPAGSEPGYLPRHCDPRHCERSGAVHLSVHEVTMDCFASLAMTVDIVSRSRSVPTITCEREMVGTALARLCPP